MKPHFIYDRDNLNQVLKGIPFTTLLKQHGYQKKSDFLAELQKKALHSVLITGLPGSGKTSFAMKHIGAKALTENDLPQLFHLDDYEMVFTRCEPDTKIAASVDKIIHLQVAPERLLKQRALRNQQIKAGTDETGFGRAPGTIDFFTTNDDKIISQLKTDFAEKSRVFRYTSPNPENFEEMEELSIARDFDKSWLYTKEGISFGIGKIIIPHRGHQAYCDTIQRIGKEN
jgi:hypothetical protein